MPHATFFQRLRLLREARRELLRGAPARSLELLSDPSLGLSLSAALLRRQSLAALCREAVGRRQAGRDASFRRLLDLVAGEDPRRATALLGLYPAAGSKLTSVPRPAAASPPSSMPKPQDPASTPPPAPPAQPLPEPGAADFRFRLAVDDAGEFLVAAGSRFFLGHSRGGRADLPLFGDLEARHASITRSESFHGGSIWRVAPEGGGGHVSVAGEAVSEEGRLLRSGDVLEFGERVAARFELPDASSSTAWLEFLHGLECEGAGRILLLAPGEAGRVRISSLQGRHIPVLDLESDLVLSWEKEGELVLSSESEIRHGTESQSRFEIPLPLTRRLDFTAPSKRTGPPFGFAIVPLTSLRTQP